MKRISILGGLRDRTLAEKALAQEYTLKQLIRAAVNRESFKANAEALQVGPTRNVNRLIKVEEQWRWGGDINARIGHLQAELEDAEGGQAQRQAQGAGGARAVPKVHLRETRGRALVQSGGKEVQYPVCLKLSPATKSWSLETKQCEVNIQRDIV